MKSRTLRSSVLVILLTMLACVTSLSQSREGALTLEPYIFKTFDGREIPSELGKLWVRENRGVNSGRLIQIAFVRLKSRATSPASPIVWLAGGPGVPGTGMAKVPVYYRLFDKLRDVSDVILLDQRGTGMSSPNLECPAAATPVDAFETDQKWVRAYITLSSQCAEHWRKKGVDLAGYTTGANADDIDDLRKALGAERLSLLGHSYGTVLAQAVVRRHEKNVDRAVFANTDGPDDLLGQPDVWDLLIKKLAYFAGQDPAINQAVPDLEALYRRVLQKLENRPVTFTFSDPQTNRPLTIRVGKVGLQWLVAFAMNDARTYGRLPALFYTIDQNDYSLFKPQIEALYRDVFSRSPMANAMDCSDGWSPDRLARTRRETPKALFSNINLPWREEVCRAVSTPNGGGSEPRVYSNIPALFISGTLDTNTAPFQAEEVRWGFPNSSHLVIENAGHETLPSADVQAVVVDFFKGQDVRTRNVAFARPKFQSVSEAKASAQNSVR